MVVSEKLRALCQQMPEYVKIVRGHAAPRARDFVDIYVVVEHFGIDFQALDFQQLLRDTFWAKRVPLRLLGGMKDTGAQHLDDFHAVEDSFYPDFGLKDFDFYFQYVVEKCAMLESLWEE